MRLRCSMEVMYAGQSFKQDSIPDHFGSDRSGYIGRDRMWREQHSCESHIRKYAWDDIEPDITAHESSGSSRAVHYYGQHDNRTC